MIDRRQAIKKIALTSGAVISSATLLGALQGCSDTNKAISWKPSALTVNEASIVEITSDIIIPKGNSVSASDVKVSQFIDLLLSDVFEPAEQKKFQQGIVEFQRQFNAKFSSDFLSADGQKQQQFVLSLFDQDEKATAALMALVSKQEVPSQHHATYVLYSFLITLRELVINSYFTSEYVGENLLAYDPIPGGYNGCMPLTQDTKVWSVT